MLQTKTIQSMDNKVPVEENQSKETEVTKNYNSKKNSWNLKRRFEIAYWKDTLYPENFEPEQW